MRFVLMILVINDAANEYVRKFKAVKEIAESHSEGSFEFTKYIKTSPKYNEKPFIVTEELRNKAWEGFAAYKFLKMQIHSNMAKW